MDPRSKGVRYKHRVDMRAERSYNYLQASTLTSVGLEVVIGLNLG